MEVQTTQHSRSPHLLITARRAKPHTRWGTREPQPPGPGHGPWGGGLRCGGCRTLVWAWLAASMGVPEQQQVRAGTGGLVHTMGWKSGARPS